MKKKTARKLWAAFSANLVLTSHAIAQVTISTGAGSAAAAKVTGVLGLVLSLVQVVGFTLFTIAILLVAYKITYVENYKVVDAKNVVIGGIVFGLAATLASFFTS